MGGRRHYEGGRGRGTSSKKVGGEKETAEVLEERKQRQRFQRQRAMALIMGRKKMQTFQGREKRNSKDRKKGHRQWKHTGVVMCRVALVLLPQRQGDLGICHQSISC